MDQHVGCQEMGLDNEGAGGGLTNLLDTAHQGKKSILAMMAFIQPTVNWCNNQPGGTPSTVWGRGSTDAQLPSVGLLLVQPGRAPMPDCKHAVLAQILDKSDQRHDMKACDMKAMFWTTRNSPTSIPVSLFFANRYKIRFLFVLKTNLQIRCEWILIQLSPSFQVNHGSFFWKSPIPHTRFIYCNVIHLEGIL